MDILYFYLLDCQVKQKEFFAFIEAEFPANSSQPWPYILPLKHTYIQLAPPLYLGLFQVCMSLGKTRHRWHCGRGSARTVQTLGCEARRTPILCQINYPWVLCFGSYVIYCDLISSHLISVFASLDSGWGHTAQLSPADTPERVLNGSEHPWSWEDRGLPHAQRMAGCTSGGCQSHRLWRCIRHDGPRVCLLGERLEPLRVNDDSVVRMLRQSRASEGGVPKTKNLCAFYFKL